MGPVRRMETATPSDDKLYERRFIDGLAHLARGLGFSTSTVGKTACTNERTDDNG